MEILNQIILSNLQQLEIPFFLSSLSSEIYHHVESETGFPGDSDGKESACNAGDPGLIPGSGRSAGEGVGYPLQYSRASLVAQLLKNPPTMWETWA